MRQSDIFKFGFFFISTTSKSNALYFAGFQSGSDAHQIVIGEVIDAARTFRKVSYAIDPRNITSLEDSAIENLCRIAVSQFLSKIAHGKTLDSQPLDLSGSPWNGTVQQVRLATPIM